jgi:hypothetical protein
VRLVTVARRVERHECERADDNEKNDGGNDFHLQILEYINLRRNATMNNEAGDRDHGDRQDGGHDPIPLPG